MDYSKFVNELPRPTRFNPTQDWYDYWQRQLDLRHAFMLEAFTELGIVEDENRHLFLHEAYDRYGDDFERVFNDMRRLRDLSHALADIDKESTREAKKA